ncbi:MAG: DUF1080 domain-containing protein [Deltaproteobacteria bacterium]|nr:DUF1080 domain-containing protein [Deltaproteobacteria bacterium]
MRQCLVGFGLSASVMMFLAGAAGCQKPTPGPVASVATPAAEPTGPNTLSASESAEGWKLLFDGQTLTGWHPYNNAGTPVTQWKVEDGTIAWAEKGADLVTDDDYASFELSLDWKISEGGNSGVFFHVTEDHKFPWETGPEMQILDDERHGDGKNPKTSAGANYALDPPEGKTLNPVGQWNTAKLVVKGDHVDHWLNGKKVVSYTLWSDGWKAQVAASKFSGMPDYGLRKTGRIVLQDHGNHVWFRNVKIRAL